MEKVDSFQKLGLALALGLGLGLAFQFVKMALSMDQLVSKVGKEMKKEFLDNVLGPRCGKSGLFSKARVSIRVSVRISVS